MIEIYDRIKKKYWNNFRNLKFDEQQKVIEVEVIEYCEKVKGSNKLNELNGIKSVAWLKLDEFTIVTPSGFELKDLFYEEGGTE